jgi:hypothetical protein
MLPCSAPKQNGGLRLISEWPRVSLGRRNSAMVLPKMRFETHFRAPTMPYFMGDAHICSAGELVPSKLRQSQETMGGFIQVGESRWENHSSDTFEIHTSADASLTTSPSGLFLPLALCGKN